MPNILNKDHLIPQKAKRYKKTLHSNDKHQAASFNKADDIIDEVYVDICNGVARSDIEQKLMKGIYQPQDGKGKSYTMAKKYYNTALERMHYNTDIEHEKLKALFYNRYESLLEEAVKRGDVFNARAVLDSMAKIFLGTDKNNTNILINSDKDGGITVNFGFDKNET